MFAPLIFGYTPEKGALALHSEVIHQHKPFLDLLLGWH